MRLLTVILAFLAILTFAFGCSKDKDEVSELEQEVIEEQSEDQGEDYVAETAPAGDTSMLPESTTEPTVEVQEYEKTPEAAPAEEPQKGYEQPTGPGYTIQIASGTNLNYARYLADKFVTRGYEAYISEATVNGVGFYRIRIGSYSTIADARRVGEELKDKYSVNYWIDKSI